MHNVSWHASATSHRRHSCLPCALPLPLAAFKDGQLDLPAELRKLQAQLCAALAAAPAPNATAIVPADLQQLVRWLEPGLPACLRQWGASGSFATCLRWLACAPLTCLSHLPCCLTLICCIPSLCPSTLQLQTRLCNGTQPSAATDLGSLAPTVEQLLGGGLGGLAGQLDTLLGTNGTVQVCVCGCVEVFGSCVWQLCMHLASHQLTPGQQMLPSLTSPARLLLLCRALLLGWPTAA